MRLRSSLIAISSGLAITGLALVGCATAAAPSAATADAAGVSIVTSTNVYGSIAAAIGGDHVTVTSIITSPAQDPHSFEASAQHRLVLSKADLVIENGGGYDPFIDTLLEASSAAVPVINASEASGLLSAEDHEAAHEDEAAHEEGDGHGHLPGFNEHVWYSFSGVDGVAEQIAAELSMIDAANAAAYTANYEAFAAELAELSAAAEGMHDLTSGLGVAITEPVPLYLLEAVGLSNHTPADFSEAIEEGTDVAPTVLKQTLDLFRGDAVALLAYNEQTASAETERLLSAAEEGGIPVVEFTETLPEGADYVSWMTSNLSAISGALGE